MARRPKRVVARGALLLSASLVFSAVTGASAMASSSAAPIVGVWGSDLRFPQLTGALTVDGRVSPWTASIGAETVAVVQAKRTVAFAIPGGRGRFRGEIIDDGTIRGTWFQPATAMNGLRYASPVVLQAGPLGVWRGEVHPLIDRITWYVAIQRRRDGTLGAFLRDPGANVGMGRPFIVRINGGDVALRDVDDTSDELFGRYDTLRDWLDLDVPALGTLHFTRRIPADEPGFMPRTPPTTRWAYREPLPRTDGWRVGTLSQAGIAENLIESLVHRILVTKTTSYRSPAIQALLIARHGKLALEEYFDGFDAVRTHDLRSAGKSFTGLMVGIALDHGAHFSLSAPVESLFPQDRPLANPDPRKNRITVENLLTMTSGLACDDNDPHSPGEEDRMYAQTWQPDYYRYALNLPMARKPGMATAVYCTAGINLLGGITRATLHRSVIDTFDQFVARPLQIEDYHLNVTPTGDAYAGGGLFLRARDALKLGQLVLDGGIWNGHRIVSAAWLRASTTPHAVFRASRFADAHGYGYTWHLFAPTVGGHKYREFMAQGNGGQLIIVLPELDAAALFLGANYNNYPTWRSYYDVLVPRYIIPAMNLNRAVPQRSLRAAKSS